MLRSLVIVIVVLGGTILAMTFLGARTAVRTLSAGLIDRTVQEIDARLDGFFRPIADQLQVLRTLGERGLLPVDDPERLDEMLGAVIDQHRNVSSVLIADERGREHMLLRVGDDWSSRQTRRDQWGDETRWRRWSEKDRNPVASRQSLDYDPRNRLWFSGALRAVDGTAWTAPYPFYTTREPGITASTSYEDADGIVHVVGIDVMLREITAFTRALRVSERGMVFVLSDIADGLRIIGLPAHARYDDPEHRQADLLKKPAEIGIDVAQDAAAEFPSDRPPPIEPQMFASGGEQWWGQVRPYSLDSEQQLWIAVVVPNADLVGGLATLRLWIIVVTFAALIGAVLLARKLALRYSEPVEELVQRSERIAQGNLAAADPVATKVAEVHHLASAQERMKIGLRSLMKMARDLQLARQIQQSTFPERLPELPGFELYAWAEPAEETGGDTYDAIGLEDPDGHTTGALLLLADATGHGVGAALSVAEIRALLRMAVRLEGEFADIVRHVNEQLYEDLPPERFITTWLARLDAPTAILTCFSAGQAPLLHYRRADDTVHRASADTPPLGIIPDIEIEVGPPVKLEPGDIYAVLSDGFFEAAGPDGELFGTARVEELIRRDHDATPEAIIDAVRAEIETFTHGAPADDDRTALIIKRAR
ncbi:MAG: SpoIIE family protein phosphatase [Planctomycetes bacterium]|nr:SpoIIE family protein phosphatase [Planctomycetota bacterium]